MTYRIGNILASSKKFEANKIKGLPNGMSLKFKTLHVRVYKSEESNDLFFCSITVPTLKDDQGYVLELETNDYFRKDTESSCSSERFMEKCYDPEEDTMVNMSEQSEREYNASSNGIEFNNIAKNAKIKFEELTEQGRTLLLLVINIPGTSFCGSALVDNDLYQK